MLRGVTHSLTQTAGPSVEPLSLTEAKAHLRVTHTAEDTLISALITAARTEVENYLGRQLITATWVLRLDEFIDTIEVPRAPLQSVTSLAYVDTNGDSQTLEADTDYTVDVYSTPGRVVPVYGGSWPSTYGHVNDVTLTYEAGYGDAATDVPSNIIHAVRLYLGHYYEHREAFIVGDSIAKLETAERLLFYDRVEHV